jgi:hypothetical protein
MDVVHFRPERDYADRGLFGLRPREWMLLLLSICCGMLELGEGERGSLFEFGVGAGADLESS